MFHHARLKLTAWYLLIIMLISISFSIVLYRVLTNEFERLTRNQRTRIERRIQQPVISAPISDPDILQEANERLFIILALINGAIFIISGATGYFLAGKTLKPISEMLEEQNRFISDASHELKTPLTALKSSMEVYLRDKNLNLKEAKQLIAESIEEVDKLQALQGGLLELAKYQKPNGTIKFKPTETKTIIQQAISKVQPMASLKKITIKNQTKSYQITADEYSLVDLFVIILDNAIKYSPPKSTITLETEKKENAVAISINDQGIGISPNDLPHIFDRFYRADQARTKTSKNGFGLGLSIAQKIVKIHEGTIKIESNQKNGTKFIVILQNTKGLKFQQDFRNHCLYLSK